MEWPWAKKRTAEHEAPAKGIKGTTVRVKSGPSDRFASRIEVDRELASHQELNRIYEATVAGSIIDTETDDLFAQGWALQGESPDDVARVREYLTATGFEQEVKKMCVQSKVYGFGFAEVGTIGGKHVLVAHDSFNIVPEMDEDGWLDALVQRGKFDKELARWRANEGIILALRPSASTPGTGRSELAQAYEAIVDYENIRKANVAMIERVGYPSFEVEFTDADGISSTNMLEGEIADIAPGSAFATGLGTKLNTINAQGVTQVQTYAETALQAIAAAMQIPRAMVGLSDNSEATAKVTLSKYYNRIAAEQQIIAQTMQARFLDIYVLPDLGIKRGAVQLQFNNPDPEAQLKKAQLLQVITGLDPTDPEFLLSVEEMAEIWGKHPKAGEYDGDKLRDELMARVARHIAEAQGATPAQEAPQ